MDLLDKSDYIKMNDILTFLFEKKDENKSIEEIVDELGLSQDDYQDYINEIVRFCRNNPPEICHYAERAYSDGTETIMNCTKSTERCLNKGGFIQ